MLMLIEGNGLLARRKLVNLADLHDVYYSNVAQLEYFEISMSCQLHRM